MSDMNEMMTKVGIEDDAQTAIMKTGAGNPGAIIALVNIARNMSIVDPLNTLGIWGVCAHMNDLNIDAPHIHVLYKDICESKPERFIAMMRAWQLGMLNREEIIAASQCRERHTMPAWDIRLYYKPIKTELDGEFYPEKVI